MMYSRVESASGEILDEALAVFMPGPHSCTREDVAEIHYHGGEIAARRAFLNGRIDLSRAEAVMQLIKTVSHNTTGDAADVTYTFHYDELGRKTSVQVGSQTLSTNVYENDRDGQLSEVQYGNGGKVHYSYDDFDRLTGVRYDAETGDRYVYRYGANGAAAEVEDNHLGRIARTDYDQTDRPCQSELKETATGKILYRTLLKYDKFSNLEQFTEKTGDEIHTSKYAYDRDNRVTEIQYDGTAQKVSYTYDDLGRVTSRTVECGSAAGKLTSSYEYVDGAYGTNSTTPLVKKITQNGISFEYAYDTRGNIISEKRGNLTTTYAYDALGQLIRVNDPHENATWVYNYDRGGNILSKVKYAYTEGELDTAVETIPYAYGDSNWKDKLTSYNGQAITYDAIGNPLNDGERQYEWEAGRRLKKMIVKGDPADGIEDGFDEGSATSLKLEFSNGNLLMGEVVNTTVSAKVYRKGEDVTDEYAAAAFNWTRTSGDESADASWNAAHSGMKSITVSANELTDDIQIQCTLTGTSSSYGSVDVNDSFIASHTRGVADSNDTLSIEDGTLFVTTDDDNYRLSGNELKALYPRLNGSVTTNAWVYHTQPLKTIEFKYNSAGLRVQKKVTANGKTEVTDYTLHGKLVTHMTVGSDKLHFFYDAQSRPTKVNFNGVTYTYFHNLQGDVVGILDNDGNLVVEYKYDAWGKLLSTTGSLADTLGVRNPFRYRGYVSDEESGMYYLRSRYFNPAIGRFVNADGVVIPGLLCSNLFAYCSNNPLSRVDTSGYGWHEFWQGVGNWFSNVGKKIGDAIRYDAEIRADVDLRMANNIGNRLSEAVGWLKKTASAVEKWWNDSAKSWIKQAWEDTKEYVGNAYYIQWQSDILSKEMTYNAASKAANWISKNWRGWVANFEKAWSITTWAATGCEIFKLIVIPKSFIIGSWIVEGIFIVYDWIEEKE